MIFCDGLGIIHLLPRKMVPGRRKQESITAYFMETYRSGHNGADSKSVCGQPHEGSNPSVSARKETPFVYQTKGVSFQRNKSLPGFVKFAS